MRSDRLLSAAQEAHKVLAGVDRYRPPSHRCHVAMDLLAEALDATVQAPRVDPDQLSLLDL